MRESGDEDSGKGLAGAEVSDLRGVAFARRPYRQYTRDWDHDHCESCMAGFSEDGPGDLREGWTTTAKYEPGAEYTWLCDSCFGRLQEQSGLRAVEDARPVRPLGAAPEIGTPHHKPYRVHD